MLDLARRVKGARALEIQGSGFGIFEPMTREIDAFLSATESEPVPDTALATISSRTSSARPSAPLQSATERGATC
jgi:hypothetical protein